MGYADKMIVLRNSKIIANNTPQHLYKNPETPLIASFFGEFNVLDNDKIVYANQLELVEKSDLKVKVKHSFFKGNHYLVEADLNGKKVFFEYPENLKIITEISLKINLK